MIRGLYRVPAKDGRPEDVRVDNDGIEHPIEERIYSARGYLPPSQELPWDTEYLASKSARDSAANDPAAAKAERERVKQDFMRRFRK